jgi:hypothetical protein
MSSIKAPLKSVLQSTAQLLLDSTAHQQTPTQKLWRPVSQKRERHPSLQLLLKESKLTSVIPKTGHAQLFPEKAQKMKLEPHVQTPFVAVSQYLTTVIASAAAESLTRHHSKMMASHTSSHATWRMLESLPSLWAPSLSQLPSTSEELWVVTTATSIVRFEHWEIIVRTLKLI